MVKRNKFSLLLIGITTTIVAISVIMSITKIETPHFSEFYNKKFVPAMTNISRLVPKNESIVSSAHYGNIVYFVDHKLLIPHAVSSERSLVSYMIPKNLTYLLVNENQSTVRKLAPLFSHDGLKNLDRYFQKLAEYSTDSNSKFHLYRLKGDWTFTKITPDLEFYNKKFISAITNISSLVPKNESIVSSVQYGNNYFGNHKLLIPHAVSSERSLVSHMVPESLTYLLVNENLSAVTKLAPLFSHDGLKNLDRYFQKLAEYSTDSNSKLHLYRLKGNWTFTKINPDLEFYNKKFISAITNISSLVPKNESIVSSVQYGENYFGNHKLLIPYTVSSERSLVSHMVRKDLTYLLVNENLSAVTKLAPLFSHDGLKNLDRYFQKLAEYSTDSNSKLHLYRLKGNWTFR